jgi:hypothetical protein
MAVLLRDSILETPFSHPNPLCPKHARSYRPKCAQILSKNMPSRGEISKP